MKIADSSNGYSQPRRKLTFLKKKRKIKVCNKLQCRSLAHHSANIIASVFLMLPVGWISLLLTFLSDSQAGY
jgi:hypothetical protein